MGPGRWWDSHSHEGDSVANGEIACKPASQIHPLDGSSVPAIRCFFGPLRSDRERPETRGESQPFAGGVLRDGADRAAPFMSRSDIIFRIPQ